MNRKPKIMFIDDDRTDSFLMKRIIKRNFPDYDLTIDDSLYSCFIELPLINPDLLILDWNFKYCTLVDETEVFEKITTLNKPIIIFSGLKEDYIINKIIEKIGKIPENIKIVNKGNASELINFIDEMLKVPV